MMSLNSHQVRTFFIHFSFSELREKIIETKNKIKKSCYLMIFEEDLRARKQEAEKKRTRKSGTELHNPKQIGVQRIC